MPARAWARFVDYFLYSLPLIVCAFGATGAAVSMLLCVGLGLGLGLGLLRLG